MNQFKKKEAILKVIRSNTGITTESIIEYLDFVNKIRYSEEEVKEVLGDLGKEKLIILNDKLWFKS